MLWDKRPDGRREIVPVASEVLEGSTIQIRRATCPPFGERDRIQFLPHLGGFFFPSPLSPDFSLPSLLLLEGGWAALVKAKGSYFQSAAGNIRYILGFV